MKNIKLKHLIIYLIPLILSVVFWMTLGDESLILYPNGTQDVEYFTDRTEVNGQSEIISHSEKDQKISLSLRLKKGFISPYGGMVLIPRTSQGFLDISNFSSLRIHLKHKNIKNIDLYLTTYQEGYSKANQAMTMRHNVFELPLFENSTYYDIPLKDMRIAQWWLENTKLTASQLGSPNWEKMTSLSLTAKIPEDDSKQQDLEISHIVFEKDRSIFYSLWILSIVLYYAVYFVLIYLRNRKKNITIQYEHIEIPKEEDKKELIEEFLAKNYSDPELSLVQTSNSLGVGEKQVSAYLKEKYQLSFKEYLNGIRLSEAKRLIKTTALSISEIAYAVGYNSPNNFNRVFKKSENCTPSQYRLEEKE